MGKADKKAVRSAFREAVFTRDRYTCRVCGRRWSPADADPALNRVNAHHITDRSEMPNGGYVPENGITVCDIAAFPGREHESCHMRCERFHITQGRECEPELHPDELYRRIGSSLELAWEAGERLGE